MAVRNSMEHYSLPRNRVRGSRLGELFESAGSRGFGHGRAHTTEDLTANPAEISIHLQQISLLLQRVFTVDAPLQELLVFAFLRLLDWTPQELLSEHLNTPLATLLDELVLTYGDISELDSNQLNKVFHQLRQRLWERPRQTIFPFHPESAGQSCLRDYVQVQPDRRLAERQLAAWSYRVLRRIRIAALRTDPK